MPRDVVAGDGLERVPACVAHDAVPAGDDWNLAHGCVRPGAVIEPVDGHVRFQRAAAGAVTAPTIGVHVPTMSGSTDSGRTRLRCTA